MKKIYIILTVAILVVVLIVFFSLFIGSKKEPEEIRMTSETADNINEGCLYTGKWNTGDSVWGAVTLIQRDDLITGEYEHDEGKLEGNATANQLRGNWTEKHNPDNPADFGRFVITMDDSCNSFVGTWGYESDAESYNWQGIRIDKNGDNLNSASKEEANNASSGDIIKSIEKWAREAVEKIGTIATIKRVSVNKDVFDNDEITIEVEFASNSSVASNRREICKAVLGQLVKDTRFTSPRILVSATGSGLSSCKIDNGGQIQINDYE